MKPIEQTPIGKEILKITGNTNSGVNYVKHRIILHTKENDIPISLIKSIEILSDFNSNTSDYIVVSFIMGMGDYIKDVYPYRDNLNITIVRIIGKTKHRETYKFVLLNNMMNVGGTMYTSMTRDELNKLQQVNIEGQAIDRISEALRLTYINGIYHNMTIGEMLYSSILTKIRETSSAMGNIGINLTMVEPNNLRVYNHIKVPTGTNVLQLPTYIHNNDYGVYNGNIGTYVKIHNSKHIVDGKERYPTLNNIYIYPLYDSTLFDTSKKKLIIYGVNSAKFDLVENTYLLDGDVLSIIAGKSTNSIDDGENTIMNQGVGITSSNATEHMERLNSVTDDGIIMDNNKTNETTIDKERTDKANNIRYIGADDNLFKYRSDIIKNTMMLYQIQWNYCDPNLIYPGMPVMYVYVDGLYGMVKLKGTVQSMYVLYNEGSNTTNALINIMVEKPYYKVDNTLAKSGAYKSKN